MNVIQGLFQERFQEFWEIFGTLKTLRTSENFKKFLEF